MVALCITSEPGGQRAKRAPAVPVSRPGGELRQLRDASSTGANRKKAHALRGGGTGLLSVMDHIRIDGDARHIPELTHDGMGWTSLRWL